MSELKKGRERIVFIDHLIEKYQQHPSMRRVNVLIEQLKQV